MRIHTVGRRPATRMLTSAIAVLALAGLVSGVVPWCWTQAACLVSLRAPMRLPAGDAAHAMWRLVIRGGWSTPCRAFPRAAERAAAPGAPAYALVTFFSLALLCWAAWKVYRRVRSWRAGSPLGKEQRTIARRAVDRGWVRSRTWAVPDRPAPAVGAGASLGPPVPRRDRTGAGTDAGGRA